MKKTAVRRRVNTAGTLGVILVAWTVSSWHADAVLAQTPEPDPDPAAEEQPQAAPRGPAASRFETQILAGGAVNELLLVDVDPKDLARLPRGTIAWQECANPSQNPKGLQTVPARSKVERTAEGAEPSGTLLTLRIPEPPCRTTTPGGLTVRWPIYQDATVVIPVEGSQTPFEVTVPVSVRWFPLAMTFLFIAIVYPGCALVSFYLARRRFKKRPTSDGTTAAAPSFLQQLDPVQITANQYGRGSLPKFQIFGFSFIVFGLLLYYQFRTGILSGLSQDVLFLLGISAVGTVGGKITYAAKRRFSLDNWVWLRRRKWQPQADEGAGRRAKWRDLIVDADTEEFDPYSFQMAIFSIVVAVALVSSSLMGLSTFEIPDELLQLLGLSQIVFIAGKASEKSGYKELDDKIRRLREHERSYQTAHAAAANATDPKEKADAQARADTARAAFKSEVAQAADMFVLLYRDSLPKEIPGVLLNAHEIEPEGHAAASGTPPRP